MKNQLQSSPLSESIAIHGDAWALLEREEKYDVIAAKFTYIAIFPRLCHRHPNHLIK